MPVSDVLLGIEAAVVPVKTHRSPQQIGLLPGGLRRVSHTERPTLDMAAVQQEFDCVHPYPLKYGGGREPYDDRHRQRHVRGNPRKRAANAKLSRRLGHNLVSVSIHDLDT